MKKLNLFNTLLAAAGVAFLAGCTTPTTVQPQSGGETVIVQHEIQPPAAQPETIPPTPDISDIWIRGAWEWRDNQWVWISGHWESPNPGHEWIPSHWDRTDNGYVWVTGHWE